MQTRPPRALVVYESMYGATRLIAEAVADGMHDAYEVECLDVAHAGSALTGLSLLVVGSPTHGRTLPTAESRAEAVRWLSSRMHGHRLEPGAKGLGIREWLTGASLDRVLATGFTTRADLPRLLSGSALGTIYRGLRRAGARLISRGFEARVDEHAHLVEHEQERARAWGRQLATRALGWSKAEAPAA